MSLMFLKETILIFSEEFILTLRKHGTLKYIFVLYILYFTISAL